MNSTSPTKKVNLEELFEVSESIEALAESNPELYEAIKSHFSAAPSPLETGSVRRQSKIASIFHGKSHRFSLDSLPPNVAEIMSLFDFDGNGKVTLDEVRQGAQELKASRKKNKIAVWAMVVQFLVYTALTAGSCGVLYHFLFLMKDTTVDPSTGSLMVKDGDDNDVEVSVKSHGTTFSYDGTAVDAITGEEKGCVSSSQAVKMFEHVLEGTTLKFVEEDIATGAVSVVSVGTNSSVWTDSIMDLGGLTLVPDAECAQAFVGEEEESNRGNRVLSSDDILDAHIASREKFMLQHFGSTTMARRLEYQNVAVQELTKMKQEIDNLGYRIQETEKALSVSDKIKNDCIAVRDQCLDDLPAALAAQAAAETELNAALAAESACLIEVSDKNNEIVRAEGQRDDALAAQSAAEEAKDTAETERDNALAAQSAAEEAKDTAETERDDAQELQFMAERQRDNAVAAQSAAEEAKDTAESERDDALAAQSAAEEAQATAESERNAAEAARFTALNAQATAARERDIALTAQSDAERAKDIAETERDAAESAHSACLDEISDKNDDIVDKYRDQRNDRATCRFALEELRRKISDARFKADQVCENESISRAQSCNARYYLDEALPVIDTAENDLPDFPIPLPESV